MLQQLKWNSQRPHPLRSPVSLSKERAQLRIPPPRTRLSRVPSQTLLRKFTSLHLRKVPTKVERITAQSMARGSSAVEESTPRGTSTTRQGR